MAPSISEHKAMSLWVTLREYSQSTDSGVLRREEAAGDHQVWGTLKVFVERAVLLSSWGSQKDQLQKEG